MIPTGPAIAGLNKIIQLKFLKFKPQGLVHYRAVASFIESLCDFACHLFFSHPSHTTGDAVNSKVSEYHFIVK